MMNEAPAFNLLAAKLEALRRDMEEQLNRDLFSGPLMSASLTYPPYPRWKRMRDRVRGYLTTLWLALCGHDFDADREDW